MNADFNRIPGFRKSVLYKGCELKIRKHTKKYTKKIAISIKICTNRMYNNQISLSKDYNKVKHI